MHTQVRTLLTTRAFLLFVVNRMDELQGLGGEFQHAFYFLSPVLEQIGGGQYREKSIWYELAANNSVHVLFLLAKLNSQLPDYNNLRPISFQPFLLRQSFIPSYVLPFDLSVVTSQILRLTRKGLSEAYQDPDAFWAGHFRITERPFRPGPGGRLFDGTFWTDGVGASVLKRVPGTEKGVRITRRRGVKRKARDEGLFPYFDTFDRQALQQFDDVVFADPNRRDLLFMMHKSSRSDYCRTLRFTSVTRRRYLSTKINQDRAARFIKRQQNRTRSTSHCTSSPKPVHDQSLQQIMKSILT